MVVKILHVDSLLNNVLLLDFFFGKKEKKKKQRRRQDIFIWEFHELIKILISMTRKNKRSVAKNNL